LETEALRLRACILYYTARNTERLGQEELTCSILPTCKPAEKEFKLHTCNNHTERALRVDGKNTLGAVLNNMP